MTEEQLQAKCTQWFWNEFISLRRTLFHVDNNSWNAIIGAKKRALGVCKGPSDLVFVCYDKVIFMECKVGNNKQMPEQIDFQNKVEDLRHEYVIFRTFEEFRSIILKNIL